MLGCVGLVCLMLKLAIPCQSKWGQSLEIWLDALKLPNELLQFFVDAEKQMTCITSINF